MQKADRGRQETYYALCDAVWEMGLAQSRGQAKRLCIQGAITVNGKAERDPWRRGCGDNRSQGENSAVCRQIVDIWRWVCRFDEITKGG